MKHLITALALLMYSFGAFAQNGLDKIDSQLKLWIAEPNELIRSHQELFKNGPISNPMVAILFKANGKEVSKKIKNLGGEVHTQLGNIYTAIIPYQSLLPFASLSEVDKIEASKYVKVLNDKARQLTGADKVNLGGLPGGLAFTGKNVIIGVFDTGLDFAHPDFRKQNDNSQTRILSIWDQNVNTGNKPQNYTYGTEFTQAQLNAALNNPNTINTHDYSGHGTYVTGTAAGLRGMAPEAEIIFVKGDIHWDSDSTVVQDAKNIIDGVTYIKQKAALAGKPCVVNLSLGYYIGGARDGSTLIEQAFDYLVSNNPKFFLTIAVGNENEKLGHFGGFELKSDSIWTYMSTGMLYGVFNNTFNDSILISFCTDSLSTSSKDWSLLTFQKSISQSPWISLSAIKNASNGIQFSQFYGNGDTAISFKLMAANYDANRTELRLFTKQGKVFENDSQSTFAAARLQIKGKGIFHAWWEQYQVDFLYNPSQFLNHYTNNQFRNSDDKNATNILACGYKTISVGAHVGRPSYKNVNSQTVYGMNYNQDSSGAFAFFSCQGPTTDGRIKPDISAPGVNIISSLGREAPKIGFSMVDARSVAASGTSIACPVVTGAIALYLEQNPNVSFENLKSAIINNAIVDTNVLKFGNAPNTHFGYGRLDIYKAMGGRFHTSTAEAHQTLNNLLVFPNPAHLQINFDYNGIAENNLAIYDINGRLVWEQRIPNQFSLNIQNWPQGLYFFRFGSNQNQRSGKIIIE